MSERTYLLDEDQLVELVTRALVYARASADALGVRTMPGADNGLRAAQAHWTGATSDLFHEAIKDAAGGSVGMLRVLRRAGKRAQVISGRSPLRARMRAGGIVGPGPASASDQRRLSREASVPAGLRRWGGRTG